ncbi:hypothetical protein Pint_17508 [Pistacia integerrima]|uniref:Uncharacterized protein n=1 Tax=Pistacia integerrima TaxID=434235 RepID=A0ACC0YYL4_9ROSI|nr:hypothetical protein Pint_17508 [Pistacia integerrima]
MYHSSAVMLPDGKVLIVGSNTHDGYDYNSKYPTELRVEKFSPPYLDPSLAGLRQHILDGFSDKEMSYDQQFSVKVSSNEPKLNIDEVKVTMYTPAFTTHGISMNQRLFILGLVDVVSNLSTQIVHNIIARAPRSGEIAPPGYYLLSVISKRVPNASIWAEKFVILLTCVGAKKVVEAGQKSYQNVLPQHYQNSNYPQHAQHNAFSASNPLHIVHSPPVPNSGSAQFSPPSIGQSSTTFAPTSSFGIPSQQNSSYSQAHFVSTGPGVGIRTNNVPDVYSTSDIFDPTMHNSDGLQPTCVTTPKSEMPHAIQNKLSLPENDSSITSSSSPIPCFILPNSSSVAPIPHAITKPSNKVVLNDSTVATHTLSPCIKLPTFTSPKNNQSSNPHPPSTTMQSPNQHANPHLLGISDTAQVPYTSDTAPCSSPLTPCSSPLDLSTLPSASAPMSITSPSTDILNTSPCSSSLDLSTLPSVSSLPVIGSDYVLPACCP